MKAYKVVEGFMETNHHLHSIVTQPADGGVEYKINEWTIAQPRFRKHGYHLLVFKTLGDAQRCASLYWWPGSIYECRVRGIIRKIPPMLDIFSMERILCDKSIDTINKSTQGFPAGTIMARKVKLTRFVKHTY